MNDDKAQAIEILKERYPGASYHFSNRETQQADGNRVENEFHVFLTGMKGLLSGTSDTSWVDAVEDIDRYKGPTKEEIEKRHQQSRRENLKAKEIAEDLTIIAELFRAASHISEERFSDYRFDWTVMEILADRLTAAEKIIHEHVEPYRIDANGNYDDEVEEEAEEEMEAPMEMSEEQPAEEAAGAEG